MNLKSFSKFFSFILSVTFIAATFSKGFAQTVDSYPTYVVQPGDSLSAIADTFGTSVQEILFLNNLTDPNILSPGEVLLIPGLNGIKGQLILGVSQLGESLSDIEVEYDTIQKDLIYLNKITSPLSIYPGNELIIPVSSSNTPYPPIGSTTLGETLLEKSVKGSINPQEVNLVNRRLSYFDFFIGSTIFGTVPQSENVSIFAPVFESVKINPLPLIQGGTHEVYVQSLNPVDLHGSLDGHELHFFSTDPGKYYALQGIHALAKTGLSSFRLYGKLADGSTFDYEQSIVLKPGNFDTDPNLIVDPSFIDPKITEPENELVLSLVSKINPTRYWQGMFQSPAVYQYYNSKFGTRRTYNNDPTITFHTGLDFGGGITLPIYAPADGQVVFAGLLTVRGNAVFINHGWGVFSGFFHQNSIKVKVGDMVKKGDVIGEVGNTGRVDGANDYPGAGAHLHWEVWVSGVQVDPRSWLKNEYP